MKHLFTSYYDDKGMYVIYNEETANADSVIEYVVVMLEQFINTLAEESDETIENVKRLSVRISMILFLVIMKEATNCLFHRQWIVVLRMSSRN